MKYIKIRIVEYRDYAAYDALQQAAAELNQITAAADAAMREALQIEVLAKHSQNPADLALATSETTKAQALASSVIAARMAVKYASEAHSKKAFMHAKVGTLGYQEIDPAEMKVVRLLDEAGNPFPTDAVFGYEIFNANPPMPPWGIADLSA